MEWQDKAVDRRVQEAVNARRFHLHYQPIVSVAGGEVVGVEALLRLNSDVGRVRSDHFLPLLESALLWPEVGAWVLSQACRQALPWVASEVWLTLNVSAQQVGDGYAAGVLRTLETAGFPPEFLCLELTSTVGLDPALAWAELRQLKYRGVRLLIDDFGTAGSSIADLAQYRLDGVKIAPAFVAGLGSEPESEAIISALVGLAHALDMTTIAEGVETADQRDRLQAIGCDLAQGYHFMRPGEPSLIPGYIAAADDRAGLPSGHGVAASG